MLTIKREWRIIRHTAYLWRVSWNRRAVWRHYNEARRVVQIERGGVVVTYPF